jgi:hypothetical protein
MGSRSGLEARRQAEAVSGGEDMAWCDEDATAEGAVWKENQDDRAVKVLLVFVDSLAPDAELRKCGGVRGAGWW